MIRLIDFLLLKILWMARRLCQLRARLAERAIARPWDSRASVHIDASIVLLEAVDEARG